MAYVAKTTVASDDVYGAYFPSPVVNVLKKVRMNIAKVRQVKCTFHGALSKLK